jgi:hypothetical protein
MLINNALRPNPFHTYRDPETGRWITVFPATSMSKQQTCRTEKMTSPANHFHGQETQSQKTQAAS